MTHAGFVAVAYALGLGLPVLLGVMAAVRLRRARSRLAAVDPRSGGVA